MHPALSSPAFATTPVFRKCWRDRWRFRFAWMLGLIGAVSVGGSRGEGAGASKEEQIKAAFLYNFTKFVEWPAERFEDASSPIVVGIVGESPLIEEVGKIAAGRQAGGRTLVVRRVATRDEARRAHVLFVPAGEEGTLKELGGAGVLTVGESERFAAQRGMITFTREADKVRFAIDLEAAEEAGLKISAQLAKLATSVRRKG